MWPALAPPPCCAAHATAAAAPRGSQNDFDAFDECRAIAAAGMLVGGSAGLNVAAAKEVAERCAAEAPREGGVTIVTLLCDHGIKYLSKVYNDQWMADHDTRCP